MFQHALTIFRVRGIPIRLHVSLLLFVPYVIFFATYQFLGLAETLDLPRAALRLPPYAWGAILGVGLLASIVLHELAHCAVALSSGAKVHSITLMMLGGVSRLEKDVRPEREAWMAFAGPLTSFGLGLLGYLGYRFAPVSAEVGVALLVLGGINVMLGIFNLLPAFPMDGGRVLRGLLAKRMGRVRATRIATTVGRAMAILFGLYGLLSLNLLLVFIAFFIYAGASAERTRFEMQDVLRGIPVTAFMDPRLGEAHAFEPAAEVARRLFAAHLVGAKIVREEGGAPRTVGVVTADDLARRAAAARGVPVEAAMRDLPKVHESDDATDAIEAFGEGAPAVLVLDARDDVVGLVTPEDVRRAAMLGALR